MQKDDKSFTDKNDNIHDFFFSKIAKLLEK